MTTQACGSEATQVAVGANPPSFVAGSGITFKFVCRGSSVVERRPEKAGVGSSILPLGTIKLKSHPFFGWLFNLIALGRIE